MGYDISYNILTLYTAAIFWTLGYDTIYGAQDMSDDEIIGLKSTSIKFKNNPKIFNCYGRKPLLVLHFIDLIDSSETYDIGLPEDMTISAYSIIFPESEIEEQVEEYWANDIWFRQLSLVELEDPDSEENLEDEYYD